jgi:hypothetical protein
MALLKFKGKDARELATYGTFKPGEVKTVPDMVARNLVIGNSAMWAIETPKAEEKAKAKQFSSNKKLDTKKAGEE